MDCEYEDPSERTSRVPPKAQAMLDFEEVNVEASTKIDFAVAVPLFDDHQDGTTMDGFDEDFTRPRPKVGQTEAEAYIVGTILKLGEKSANVWFGWGQAQPDSNAQNTVKNGSKNRFMGSFVVAAPKRAYKGAFDDSNSVSKLVGTNSLHNDLVTINMASRLSEKLQMVVFCSSNLDDGRPDTALGGETEMFLLQSRAAAIAEREIVRLLVAGKAQAE